MGRGGDGGPPSAEAVAGTGRGDAPGVLAPEQGGDVRMVMWDGTELKNTDLTATRNEWLFKPPQPLRGWLESTVAKERDFPMVYLIFNITTIVLPSAFCQYRFADQLPWWTGLLHVVMIYALFLQRYILCLHYSEHRRIFKKQYSFLNGYLQNVVAPFMGMPSGMYHLHHVVMHHKENNIMPWDLSSTEPYQRDSFLHWLHYLFRFMIGAWVELPYYAVKRGKPGLAAFAVGCAAFYFGSVSLLRAFVSASATFWVFMVPMPITSMALMFGNWSQHIYVDPKVAERRTSDSCNYALTYNCVNHFENQKTFNDGYHVIHHIKPGLHWTMLPQEFENTLAKHREEGALTFTGHFFEIGLWTFTHNWDQLFKHSVHLLRPGEQPPSRETVIAKLKDYLKPLETGTWKDGGEGADGHRILEATKKE